jgi:hypothetical protein
VILETDLKNEYELGCIDPLMKLFDFKEDLRNVRVLYIEALDGKSGVYTCTHDGSM